MAALQRDEYLLRAREFAQRGTDRHNARLDEDKVRLIRSNPEGKTRQQLAFDFGVHLRTVDKCATYETWTHVK